MWVRMWAGEWARGLVWDSVDRFESRFELEAMPRALLLAERVEGQWDVWRGM